MIAASGWFAGFSAVSSLTLSVVGVFVAALAAFFAYRAFHVQHQDAITDRVFDSLGDLLAALKRIEFATWQLSRSPGDGLPAAPQAVLPEFINFQEAIARAKLALAERPSGALGPWIMYVANNLAVALLLADEFGADWQHRQGWARDLDSARRPAYVPDEHRWELLKNSASFWTAYAATQDLGPPPANDLGLEPVDRWWSSTDPYLTTDTGWLVQHARLLSDFGETYISPWAENLVMSAHLTRSKSAAAIEAGGQLSPP
jgi:hypothetical protein